MDFDVEQSPRYRLSALSRLWTSATERAYVRDFGLSLAEWRIVAIVGAEQPISAGAIADRGLLKKAHISRLVARLIERGLLDSEVDRRDARRSWLRLTAAGRTLFERVAQASLTRDAIFLAALTPEEQRALDTLLRKLTRHAEAMADPADVEVAG